MCNNKRTRQVRNPCVTAQRSAPSRRTLGNSVEIQLKLKKTTE